MSNSETLALPEREEGRPWPIQGSWTYDDYLCLPDDGRRYEVLRGVLYVSTTPPLLHQMVLGQLMAPFGNFVAERNLGLALLAPLDILLPRDLAAPVQPDLVFLPGPRRASAWGDNFVGVPGLVLEVISPSSRDVDERIKLAIYQEAGVPEYWLVDPLARTVAVYALSEDKKTYTIHRSTAGETVSSAALPGLEIELDEIFLPE